VPVELPRLFGMYLSMGARVCSEPAIDRAFGTIDYLVLFDLADLDDRGRRRFLPGLGHDA
jgi:putative hemolysin